MTRRLRFAGTALGLCLLPACIIVPPNETARRPIAAPPASAQASPAGPVVVSTPASIAKTTRAAEKFGEERAEATPTIVPRPLPISDAPPVAESGPKLELAPVEHQTKEPPAAPATSTMPAAVRSRLLPAKSPDDAGPPKPEPVPDAEGIIRPHWPVLKGTLLPLVDGPVTGPKLPSPLEQAPDGKPNDVPAASSMLPIPAPTPLPPGIIGSSVHQSNASPAEVLLPNIAAAAVEPVLPVATMPPSVETVAAAPDDSALIRAVRAFQNNRPDEAVEHLKAYDPDSQQLLLALMPALVRLSENKLQQIKPEELDAVLEQLTRVPNVLRSRASLLANNVRLCREVHNFGHVDPFANGHQFHPGDIVYLYMEMANFSCTPRPKGDFVIVLASSLELLDASGQVVWRADPKEVPDVVSSPPHDYYRNFRLCVPNVAPGTYALAIRTIDRPTGREVRKSVELRIGPK